MNPVSESGTLIDDLCDNAGDDTVDDTGECNCSNRSDGWSFWKLVLDLVGVDSRRLFEENEVRRKEIRGVSTALEGE